MSGCQKSFATYAMRIVKAKMTKTQMVTIIAYVAFIAYEFYLASLPAQGNIRIDWVIFPPILIVLSLISLYQYVRK